MKRFIKSHILTVFHLIITTVLLAGAFCLTPAYAAQTAPIAPADLLQFMAAGHVLGFQADGVYVASGDHMLRVEFAGTPGVKPVSGQMPSTHGKARPLGRVSYPDLWPGVQE